MGNNRFCDYVIECIDYELLDDVLFSIKAPLDQRYGFKYNNTTITLPRVMTRVIGMKSTQNEYYEMLGKIDSELSNLGDLYLKVIGGLDRSFDVLSQAKVDDIIRSAIASGKLDTYELTTLLDERNLFPKLKSESLTQQLQHNFRGILEYYKSNNEIEKQEISRIIRSLVHFMNAYMPELFYNFDYFMVNPKVVYYGEISEEEVLFLLILGTLGCDVLYFNPKENGKFKEIDKLNVFSKEVIHQYRGEVRVDPFNSVYKVSTDAYNASEEIQNQLFNESTGIFKPWQLSQNAIESLTLNTTYDELYILAKENSSLRTGFKVDNTKVFIPNIFAKIAGTHSNTEFYFKEIQELLDSPKRMFISKFPYMKPCHLEYGRLEQVYPSRGYSFFDTEKMMQLPWWPYKDLRTGLQKNIANKIKELCLSPVVKNVDRTGTRDLQVDVFSVLLNMSPKLTQMLQAFDYPGVIPKVILYNNEKNGDFSYEDAILLSLLNKMGLDIFIFNPSGYNDIENFFEKKIFDIHNLETVKFSLDFTVVKKEKQKGFFKNLLGL